MDGSRFDALARKMASEASRRGFVGGLLGLGAGLIGARTTEATTCPPGRLYRPRVGCVCRQTGRPPVGGVCPCPRGQADTGDGRGCLACRADGDCPAGDLCTSYACVAGACTATTCGGATPVCDPDRGCVQCQAGADCPGFGEPCLDVTCDPTDGCVARPVGDGEPGGCPGGEVCHQGTCQPCGSSDQPCCAGGTCTEDLVCHEGTCQFCGGLDEPCCAGETCLSLLLVCHQDTCQLCGNPTEPCCADGTCSQGTCSGGFCTD